MDTALYDVITTPVVVAGESALARTGLISLVTDFVGCWTPSPILGKIQTIYVGYYFNPLYGEESTKPSRYNFNILEPTKERAILEYIKWIEYFNEGYLIEALNTYGYDYSLLYEKAPEYGVSKEDLDYWIKEAKEDVEV